MERLYSALGQAASVQEAWASVNFETCSCGSRSRNNESVSYDTVDMSALMTLSFFCGQCDTLRVFTFDASLFYPRVECLGAVFSNESCRSRLLDPIQYCHIAFHHSRRVPADLASLSKDNLEMARWNAEWALAALVESLKFFDAETLRPHDGWRTQSAFLFDENPERYARRCLMEQKKILGDVVATIDVLQQEDFLVSFV